MLRTTPVRVLEPRDTVEALAVVARDPYVNVFTGSRILASGLEPSRLGAEIWGYPMDGPLESLCYAGANLVPVEATPAAVEAFAAMAIRQGRRSSSIVGPADAVRALWSMLEPHWRPVRAIRYRQPLMVATRPANPAVRRDTQVRPVEPSELDVLFPACVAMFIEEVGISPTSADGGSLYRARIKELIMSRRALAHIDGEQVVFKAEIGAVTPQAAQIQGVWVAPYRRGRGAGVAGMAAVLDHTLANVAPAACLYVNDYNAAARAVYRRVGFVDHAEFMSVLF